MHAGSIEDSRVVAWKNKKKITDQVKLCRNADNKIQSLMLNRKGYTLWVQKAKKKKKHAKCLEGNSKSKFAWNI